MTTVGRWLTAKGVCEYAQISMSTVLREARLGRLISHKVGGRRSLRFKSCDVDAWIEDPKEREALNKKEEQRIYNKTYYTTNKIRFQVRRCQTYWSKRFQLPKDHPDVLMAVEIALIKRSALQSRKSKKEEGEGDEDGPTRLRKATSQGGRRTRRRTGHRRIDAHE